MPSHGLPFTRFEVVSDDAYRVVHVDTGVQLDAERVRRDRAGELVCDLTVSGGTIGKRDINGTFSSGTYNLSSVRARAERARHLAERAHTTGPGWLDLLEDLSQRVAAHQRTGRPAVVLRDVPKPTLELDLEFSGFRIPRAHPSILFGDGGTAKSFFALHIAVQLERRGIRCAYFDWELDAETHRMRLESLCGPDDMPAVQYVRCDRPLVHEAERLARIVRGEDIRFGIFDSVAYATDGAPESAEAAMAYFRGLRQIGIGSLNIAHITKAENGDQRPFGSAFWHNSARATWFIRRDESADEHDVPIGLYNRKANLGALARPVAYHVRFEDDRTTIQRTDIAQFDGLAAAQPIWRRMRDLLKRGPMSIDVIAETLEKPVDTIRRESNRRDQTFTRLPDGRLALLDRSAA